MFSVYLQHCSFYLRFWIADYSSFVCIGLYNMSLINCAQGVLTALHEIADGRPAALNSSCSFLSQHFLPDCPNWCARATASFSNIGMSFEHSLSQYLNILFFFFFFFFL